MSITTEEFNAQAEKIAKLRAEEAEASQAKKAITEQLEQAESRALEMLDQSGLKRYVSPFGTIGVSFRTSVKIPKTLEDKAALFEYLKKLGMYDTMVSVNSATLNSFYKSEMEKAVDDGLDDFTVPGLKEVSITPILSFRK